MATRISRSGRGARAGSFFSRSWLVLPLLCAAVLASACSGGSSSGKTATSDGPTVATPTGSPIKIGVIYSTLNDSSSQGATVAPAWADYVNQQLGGINGHPVKVFLGNDQGSPVTAQAVEQKLVEVDGVDAIVVSADATVESYEKDAISKHVALVSGTANETDWFSLPGLYETPTDLISGLTVLVAKDYGHATKFADVYCSEDPACTQANSPLNQAATALGMGFTSLSISSTEPSYTAECLKLQKEKVDYVQLNVSDSEGARFAQGCQAQGYNPTFGATGQTIGADFLKVPNLKLFGPSLAFPSSGPGPAVATFRAAMTRFAPTGDWQEGTASFTWTGLELLHAVLAKIEGTPTRQSIVQGLDRVRNLTLNGLVPNPLSYPGGRPVPFKSHPCAFVIGVAGGRLTAPAGMNTVCANKV
jgi:branched-chain amino acid transport system substrate-binding protein